MARRISIANTAQLLDRVDDQTIAVNGGFDGDTEEGVVPDVLGTGAGERSTGGTATGDGESDDGSSSKQHKLFHDITLSEKLLLVDDQTIAIDSTFDGNTEEGVVVDIFGTAAGERGTGGAATGEGSSSDDGDSENEKFLHNFLHKIVEVTAGIPP